METRTNKITFNKEQVQKGLLSEFINFITKMNSTEDHDSHWEMVISGDGQYTTVEFQEAVVGEGKFVWIESEEEAFALEDVQENPNARYEINPEMYYSFPNKENEITQIQGSKILEIIKNSKK